MNRAVSNAEFEAALSIQDNIRIMNKSASAFRNLLDPDELHRCKLIALWDTLRTWEPKGRKFTSFLFKKVQWECIRSLQQQAKQKIPTTLYADVSIEDSTNDIDDILAVLSPDLQDMIYKRYMQSMTLREISEHYDLCHETIRRRLASAIKILQKTHSKAKSGV